MIIDIIDLTDEEYSDLSAVQMAMVREAQEKKNKILAETEQQKEEYLSMLVSNNTAHNTFYALTKARLDADAEEQIAAVKDDLDYQLAYEALGSEGDENGPYRYPENPNYNLTPSQLTMEAVKRGGDRQALHERIRQHSMEASRRMKEEGEPCDLLDRLAADPAFGMTREQILEHLDPKAYIGRCPSQVDEFISECVRPAIAPYLDGEDIRVEINL